MHLKKCLLRKLKGTSVPHSSPSSSPWMEAVPEVRGKAPSLPSAQDQRWRSPSSAARCAAPNPTRALWRTFNSNNALNSTDQTCRILNKHLGQVWDQKSTAGAGVLQAAGKVFQSGCLQPAFPPRPVTSTFFKPLHTVVALWWLFSLPAESFAY